MFRLNYALPGLAGRPGPGGHARRRLSAVPDALFFCAISVMHSNLLSLLPFADSDSSGRPHHSRESSALSLHNQIQQPKCNNR